MFKKFVTFILILSVCFTDKSQGKGNQAGQNAQSSYFQTHHMMNPMMNMMFNPYMQMMMNPMMNPMMMGMMNPMMMGMMNPYMMMNPMLGMGMMNPYMSHTQHVQTEDEGDDMDRKKKLK